MNRPMIAFPFAAWTKVSVDDFGFLNKLDAGLYLRPAEPQLGHS